MAADLPQDFGNLTVSTFENQNVLTEFANRLTEVGFEGRTDNPKKIYEVLSRVVDLVSESSNKPENNAQMLKITSEKIFEYERFWKEFANGLKDLALHVNNHDFNKLMKIWEQLLEAANMSASADKQFLKKLNSAKERITKNETDIVENLKEVGFNVNLRDDKQEPICLSKGFRLAVDSLVCSGRNINLANENFQDTKLRLEQMLLTKTTQTGEKGNIATSLDEVFYTPLKPDVARSLTSPEMIAEKLGIKDEKDIYTNFVTNLIEKQFSIQWTDTGTGIEKLVKEPAEFNFYTFCDKLTEAKRKKTEDNETVTKHLQYNPRKAHVMVQLYRFCRTKPKIKYSVNELCPPVYIRHEGEWKEWDPVNKNFKPPNSNLEDDFKKWMNPHVYQCICSHANEIKPNKQDLKQVLVKALQQALEQALEQVIEDSEQNLKQTFKQDFEKNCLQALTQALEKALEQDFKHDVEKDLGQANVQNLKNVLTKVLNHVLEQDFGKALKKSFKKVHKQRAKNVLKQVFEQNFEPALEKPLEQAFKQALERAPTRPTLYWAVVDEKELWPDFIGRTQVYVGKAKPGINERWITDSKSHCKMMKKCLDNVQEMTTYESLRLKGIQLVDARILLAKLRKEKCALFVMNTYEEPEIANLNADETANIKGESRTGDKLLPRCQDWMPKNMAYGMNG